MGKSTNNTTVNEFLSKRYGRPIDLAAEEAEIAKIRELVLEGRKIERRLGDLIIAERLKHGAKGLRRYY